MAERKKGPIPIPNHMSLRAYELASERLGVKDQALIDAQKKLGEAGGTSDWHDNFALEAAHRKIDEIGIGIVTWLPALRSPSIIQPRKEINSVGLGNLVVVKLSDSDVPDEFNLLGTADRILFPDTTMSDTSPLGKAILGLCKGEEGEFEGPFRDRIRVKVLEIHPGNF